MLSVCTGAGNQARPGQEPGPGLVCLEVILRDLFKSVESDKQGEVSIGKTGRFIIKHIGILIQTLNKLEEH